MEYFFSDAHFSHLNICRGTSAWDNKETNCRNFNTIEEMNSTIIKSINSRVGKDDILYHLGDWSFGGWENIWNARKQIVCENIMNVNGNHDCFDVENTQILTENGWMWFYDWKILTPKIASYNILTNETEYDYPMGIYENNYNGEMYHLKNKLVDLFVTPNHRLYIQRKSYSDKNYKFIPINEIPKTKSRLTFKSSSTNNKIDLNINDDIIKLVSWICSDGSVHESVYGISYNIYQSDGKHVIIENLLENLNIKYTKTIRNRDISRINGIELKSVKTTNEYFIKQGTILEKFIYSKYHFPEWVYRLSKRQFMLFLEAYVLADGNKHKQNPETSWVIYGNKQQLGELQHLCFINGIRSTLNNYANNQYRLYATLSESTSEVSRYIDSLKIEQFNGKIFCFKTKNNTLIIRRNNKVCVVGNSNIAKDKFFPHLVNQGGIICEISDEKEYRILGDVKTEGDVTARDFFKEVYDGTGKEGIEIEIDGQRINLNHYPLDTWGGIEDGVISLRGHEHGKFKEFETGKWLDLDWNRFRKPVSYLEIKEIMDSREINLKTNSRSH